MTPKRSNRLGSSPTTAGPGTFGGITTILDGCDLLIGGAFAIKRMIDSLALKQLVNVRFGSKADIPIGEQHVR
jgi:hypothetical protein